VTSPRLAKATDRGRYYSDPAGGPDLISVTNVLDTAVHKHALIPWAVKLTTEWVLDNATYVAEHVQANRAVLAREIKSVHGEVRETAANLGDRIHARAEARVIGQPWPDDPEIEPYAHQLELGFSEWGVNVDKHVVAAEITVVHRTLGYAGTADLMVWLPTGPGGRPELWLIDYKTSATRPAKSVYAENAQQLAALRYAEHVLLPDDTDGAMPKIQRTGVLNLRQKSHALVEMPGDRAAFRAFRGALTNALWHHNAPTSYPALTPPASVPTIRKAA